ncbi:hypothetical protein GN244_ATG18099 [Phytophthora infestans]|uniref:Uncharacterized protein n=1 Tax=Phytophthora infestans TaxID=4787 RepID=A0A833S9D4_PHYIN|nr:hypothetical protein GN244_ATG18099 [Phytophthora infestans]KAF4139657.1 hypothetical protein GN958_ATG11142 [Phytophthora infestans]
MCTNSCSLKHGARQHSTTIGELLAKQIALFEGVQQSSAALLNSMGLNGLGYEVSVGFASENDAVCRQVQWEQESIDKSGKPVP